MHPLLFKLGPIPIHSYGFLIAIGFLTAVYVIRKLAERAQLDAERVLDLTFWTLLVGFAGARLLFIITRWEFFMSEPTAMFRVWEGGLVFFGGPLAAMPFGLWYLRRFKMPIWRTLDVLMPGLVIAHSFGRMGCLMAGCCYGKPTGGDWGVRLNSELVDPQFRNMLLHPTQVYESLALLILFFGLLWIFRRRHFDGQVFLTYMMAYPVIRSLVEIFRGDLIRGFVIDEVLSTSQFISILIFAAATAALVVRLKYVHGSKSDKSGNSDDGGSAGGQGAPVGAGGSA
jgi:phosphatidylglycerol:prolipoprotein diacylglycerol transferase